MLVVIAAVLVSFSIYSTAVIHIMTYNFLERPFPCGVGPLHPIQCLTLKSNGERQRMAKNGNGKRQWRMKLENGSDSVNTAARAVTRLPPLMCYI